MGVNIADSAIGLLLTVILVPRLGIYGYVISLYICELINCTLSLGRIIHLLGWLPNLTFALCVPTPVAVATVHLLTLTGIENIPTVPAIIISAAVYFSATALLLSLQRNRLEKKSRAHNYSMYTE